jgi:hypothetical protein
MNGKNGNSNGYGRQFLPLGFEIVKEWIVLELEGSHSGCCG